MKKNDQVSILIVDDTPQNLIAMKAVLNELNQHLVFASSAEEALRCVLKYDFAVILLDVHMPDIDGFETARLIRAREKSSYTPIIFLSALNKNEMDINQGYAMGAVDYIFKPINPVILRSKVKVFIDLFTKSTLAVNLQNELGKRQRAEQRAHKQQHQLELAESDRLSTMMEMTSAVSHELNQPLATIVNYIQGCIRRLKSNDYQADQLIVALERATQQAERAGAILHRIKNFVRKNKLYLEPVVIHDLIKNIIELTPQIMQEGGIKWQLQLSKKKLPHLMLDKIQIEQVIINLLRNSIEALQTQAREDREIIIQTILNNNKLLIINVKDNGPGIDTTQAEQLFELYFTTKPQGMGIGLSICRTIIEAHGGHIIAKNNPAGGAWMQISLPIESKHANEQS